MPIRNSANPFYEFKEMELPGSRDNVQPSLAQQNIPIDVRSRLLKPHLESARCHGLKDVSPVLVTTLETGEPLHIITSNSVYYIGKIMDEHVQQVTKPTSWPGFLDALIKKVEEVWNRRSLGLLMCQRTNNPGMME